MLLIIEIILTVKAYKKGWGGRALWPVGCIILMGLGLGVVGGLTGMSKTELTNLSLCSIPIELLLTGVMGWMATKAPADAKAKSEAVPAIAAPDAGIQQECATSAVS